MKTYTVTWEIDLEAESAVEAAQKAREIQLDPDSLATAFKVDDGSGPKLVFLKSQ